MIKESFSAELLAEAQVRGLDLSGAISRMGGNVHILPRMLRTFLREAHSVSSKLITHLEEGNWVEAHLLMHTMKGSAGIMGATRLFQLCGGLEKELKKIQSTALDDAMVDDVTREVALVIANVDWVLSQLRVENTSQPGAINVALIRQQLAELATLLREGDMRATTVYSHIDTAGLGERIVDLDDAMSALDFDKALKCCERLSGELDHWVGQN